MASCDTPFGVSSALRVTYWRNALVANPNGGGPEVVRHGHCNPSTLYLARSAEVHRTRRFRRALYRCGGHIRLLRLLRQRSSISNAPSLSTRSRRRPCGKQKSLAMTTIVRAAERFGIEPQCVAADTGSGSGDNLGWLMSGRGSSHIFRRSTNSNGRTELLVVYNHESDTYTHPAGHRLRRCRRASPRSWIDITKDNILLLRAIAACPTKVRYCPNTPTRKVPCSTCEARRWRARHRQNRGL